MTNKTAIKIILSVLIFFYLSIGFVNLDFNFMNWNKLERFFLVAWWILWSCILLMATTEDNENENS
ncbi:MAG: hypothetical protein LW595_05130 [Rickettsiales bacterium]|nr:hypothetical protein [Rickettsiales bacterium]